MLHQYPESLQTLCEKIALRERLSFEDGVALFKSRDWLAVADLAHSVRTTMNGNDVFYNINRHINYTNICVSACAFCSFYRRSRDPEGYELGIDHCLSLAEKAYQEGARELHIVGGLHPKWKLDHYVNLLECVKSQFPDLHLKAFTMVELDHIARTSRLSDEEVIDSLIRAGLGSCPGGGAEIFNEPTRSSICAHKTSAERWLELSEKVHKRGLKSNATMLYGHIETIEDRVDHLLRLRSLQDRTGGFLCFIPLPFNPAGTSFASLPGPSFIESLKTIAVSRLLLDNIPHIKAYWALLGMNLAQLALRTGADDLDGTITEGGALMESYLAKGNQNQVSREEIIRFIIDSGFEPVERDTVYNRVSRS